MIYSAIINRGSSHEAIAGLMAGTWDEYDSREWHVVKTPMFLCLTGTFGSAGTYPLPFRFGMTVMAEIAYGTGGSETRVVKLTDTSITVGAACLVRILAFGKASDAQRLF
jgi:hypothetical protein